MLNYKINTNQIRQFPDGVFQVVVKGGREEDKTIHTVSLKESYYKELTDGRITPEELVRRSFEFLLEREPKESILREFDLLLIQKYFPEFEEKIK